MKWRREADKPPETPPTKKVDLRKPQRNGCAEISQLHFDDPVGVCRFCGHFHTPPGFYMMGLGPSPLSVTGSFPVNCVTCALEKRMDELGDDLAEVVSVVRQWTERGGPSGS